MQFEIETLRACWFLAGPTASGKTNVAIELAEQIGGEIIALDSMTLYRGMDVGTAKPMRAEQERVPHHLIDVIDPHEEFSVASYLRQAHLVCCDILRRGRVPLFVGGSGLYLRAVLRGVFEGPPADREFRRRLEQELERSSETALHERLRAIDRATADRLPPRDVRRVIRAIEIHHLTGRPASELQQQSPLPPGLRPQHVYWLSPPRAWLYERINRRVEKMIEAGLVDEVRRLVAGPHPPGRTARQALGYQEIMAHLAGECSLAEAVVTVQTRTRQFAKRQHTWFRNLVECRPVHITGMETARGISQRLINWPNAEAPTPSAG